MLRENIQRISALPKEGMDIVIIVTSTEWQKRFWEKRLEETRGQVIKEKAILCVLTEDFQKGAGNGLGSLYGYQKAQELLYVQQGIDLHQKQREGASVALYHTAGQGKRLYPLTASEYGDKAAVRLPCLLDIQGRKESITLLEAVLRQTAIYSRSRRGRFSVFWADQLFIPSVSPDYTPRFHGDILVKQIPMPREEEWHQKNLSKYGIVLLNRDQKPLLLEKVSYEQYHKWLTTGALHISGGLGISMGSFSLSAPLTFALIQEFQPELIQKTAKMDSDPFFWMAFTQETEAYLHSMEKLGYSIEDAKNHHLRMHYFTHHFLRKHPEAPLLGSIDIGTGSVFWDFGSAKNYFHNLLKITQNSVEGYLLREFFLLPQGEDSYVLGSHIGRGRIKSSLILDSECENLDVEGTVIVNSKFSTLHAKNSLFYNVLEEQELTYPEGTLRADTLIGSNQEQIKMISHPDLDPSSSWHAKLPSNNYSFNEIQEKLTKENGEEARELFKKMKDQAHCIAD